jgi:hypothetical protein
MQEGDNASESRNGSRPRPVLEAKLQVSSPEASKTNGVTPVLATGGVTAAMGMGRPAGNTSKPHAHGPPKLQGLPINAMQSGVHRLVGVSNAIVTRPQKAQSEEHVRRQLGSRFLLREPAVKTQAVMSAGKPRGSA